MKLVIINGSPRKSKSNSAILAERFLTGYNAVRNDDLGQFYISKNSHEQKIRDKIEVAEKVIIIFPLYTDCMPGIVMKFFEDVHGSGILKGKRLGFIVQSGFPEAKHSVYVEKYLNKFTRRLGGEYLGTIIRGGVEGIQIMPPFMTKKLFKNFKSLGEQFAKTGEFDPETKAQLMKPYHYTAFRRAMYTLFSKTGLTNFYWDKKLKEYGAMEKRDAQPYIS
jgi:multimeric flavodoxin WrbA